MVRWWQLFYKKNLRILAHSLAEPCTHDFLLFAQIVIFRWTSTSQGPIKFRWVIVIQPDFFLAARGDFIFLHSLTLPFSNLRCFQKIKIFFSQDRISGLWVFFLFAYASDARLSGQLKWLWMSISLSQPEIFLYKF